MIYIAHRGLFQGPDIKKENHPDQIRGAIKKGYHVEIDLRYVNKQLVLGHDQPTYDIKESFLQERKMWIHCKNLEALYYFTTHISTQYNYFWHEHDQHTLTSKRYVWTEPGMPLTDMSIMVMPEHINLTLENTIDAKCYGICSDFVERIQELRGTK